MKEQIKETAVPVGHPAGKSTGPVAAVSTTDRAALIAQMRDAFLAYELSQAIDNLLTKAADMLESDAQPATSDEWLANCPQSMRDLANRIKAEMAVPQELCWCDANNIGEPGVSCGDCPTRDYAAPQPAVPQEPVTWRTDTSSGKLRFTIGNQTFTIDYDADYKEELQWMETQLITALCRMAASQPQRPKLTDEEIAHMWAYNPGWSAVDFARAIEKKVRGEA